MAEVDDGTWESWVEFEDPLTEGNVICDLDRSQHNALSLGKDARQRSDESWAKLVEKNGRLFNALKFRLAGITRNETGALFHMGITDYKSYLSTNRTLDPFMIRALPSPMEPVLANVLGVGGLLLTSDGCMVLHRRSYHTAEFRGWWDFPGGHPEPSHAKLEREGENSPDECARTRVEWFQSILDEMHDEVNVPYETMKAPKLMGIVRHRASRNRPCSLFVIPTTLTAEEVGRRFSEGGKEADESTSLALFHWSVAAKGVGPVCVVALPPAPTRREGDASETKGVNYVDQPKTFEEIKNILVPTCAFGIALVAKYGAKVLGLSE